MNLLFFNITIIIIVIGLILPELFHNEFGHYIKRLPSNINRFLILVLVACVAILNYFNDSRNSIENNRTTVSTNVEDSTVSSTNIAEADYSSTEESSATEQSASFGVSLLDLGYATDNIEKSRHLYEDSLRANGDVFNQALFASGICESESFFTCEYQVGDSAVQVREYALGEKYSRLQAKLVVLDSSSGTHTVRISAKNGLNELYTIEPGDTKDITVDVSGVSRLKIEFTNLSLVDGIAEGEQFVNTGIALADPILIK